MPEKTITCDIALLVVLEDDVSAFVTSHVVNFFLVKHREFPIQRKSLACIIRFADYWDASMNSVRLQQERFQRTITVQSAPTIFAIARLAFLSLPPLLSVSE